MFLGQYRHTFDAKNRLTVPARFRELLEGGAFITQGFDKALMVLTTIAFEQLYTRINSMNITDPMARHLRRMILGNANQLEIDKSGRILIPQYLRAMAPLEGEAVLVGQGDYFEIWSPNNWQQEEEVIQDPEASDQRYVTLNLSTR
jgi:MraZ protein